jgi:hypothetical protein
MMTQHDWEHFRRLVPAEPALQRQLSEIADWDAFLGVALRLGAERGCHFEAAEVEAALRAGRRSWIERGVSALVAEQSLPPPDVIQPTDFEGWVPIRTYWRDNQLMLDWCYLGQRRFTEPFFDQTISACLQRPFQTIFRRHTTIDALATLDFAQSSAPLAGCIFHMSRCGSTLISQLLAALPQHIVISEAPLIDSVIYANMQNPSISDAQRISWLRGVVSALGQKRNAQEQRMFIKFDSWHIVDLPLIRRAFPDVPWVFVYRDPVEVMVSHQRQPGSQMVPGMITPALVAFPPDRVVRMALDEYGAAVLAHICDAAAQHAQDANSTLVNYRHLPDAIWSCILPLFGIDPTPDEMDTMRRTVMFHAKRPTQTFEHDSSTKQREATDRVRHLAEQVIGPSYRQLEALRLARMH